MSVASFRNVDEYYLLLPLRENGQRASTDGAPPRQADSHVLHSESKYSQRLDGFSFDAEQSRSNVFFLSVSRNLIVWRKISPTH